MVHDAAFVGTQLTSLTPPSADEVAKLINSMPAKSSPMDAFPTSIMKSCADIFSPLIARLAALSFKEGVFPERYKTASVTPLLENLHFGHNGSILASARCTLLKFGENRFIFAETINVFRNLRWRPQPSWIF